MFLPQKPAKAINLTERLWFYSLMITQIVSGILQLVAAIIANSSPKLLLNIKFVKSYAYPYLVFTILTGIIFVLVMFIDAI